MRPQVHHWRRGGGPSILSSRLRMPPPPDTYSHLVGIWMLAFRSAGNVFFSVSVSKFSYSEREKEEIW